MKPAGVLMVLLLLTAMAGANDGVNLRGVRLDMTRQEVVRLLGRPSEVGWGDGGTTFFQYGPRLRIGFSAAGRAQYVHADALDAIEVGTPLSALVDRIGPPTDAGVAFAYWRRLGLVVAISTHGIYDFWMATHVVSTSGSVAEYQCLDPAEGWLLDVDGVRPGMSRETVSARLGSLGVPDAHGYYRCRDTLVRFCQAGYAVEVLGCELTQDSGSWDCTYAPLLARKGQPYLGTLATAGLRVEAKNGRIERIRLHHDDPNLWAMLAGHR